MTREDREAIIRRLEAMYGEAEDNETKEALFYAIESLKDRPRGEWIEHRKHNSTGYFFSEYECSVCHDEVWQKTEWQFCPNCGADMREGDISDEDPDNR